MTNVAILGGNGYIGRNIMRTWLEQDSDVYFFVYSRSGINTMHHSNIKNSAVDVTNFSELKTILPDKIDYIIDLVGRPEKDKQQLKKINEAPAKVMLRIAGAYDVKGMGFIQGRLGPKSFLEIKQDIANLLQGSGVPTAIVNPNLVFGNDRSDTLSKLVPLFKVLGMFSPNLKPVHVNQVAREMVDKLTRLE